MSKISSFGECWLGFDSGFKVSFISPNLVVLKLSYFKYASVFFFFIKATTKRKTNFKSPFTYVADEGVNVNTVYSVRPK